MKTPITKKKVTRFYVNFRQNGIKHHSHHAKLETAQRHLAKAVLKSLSPRGFIPHYSDEGDYGIFCQYDEIHEEYEPFFVRILKEVENGRDPYTITRDELERGLWPMAGIEILCSCYGVMDNERTNE